MNSIFPYGRTCFGAEVPHPYRLSVSKEMRAKVICNRWFRQVLLTYERYISSLSDSKDNAEIVVEGVCVFTWWERMRFLFQGEAFLEKRFGTLMKEFQ